MGRAAAGRGAAHGIARRRLRLRRGLLTGTGAMIHRLTAVETGRRVAATRGRSGVRRRMGRGGGAAMRSGAGTAIMMIVWLGQRGA